MNIEERQDLIAWLKNAPSTGAFHVAGAWGRRQMGKAANEIESLTADNERLRKALEMAGKRLYKEGAPQSYVDDVNRVLDGEEVEYYDNYR